jgi:hypothetical protein
MKIQWRKIYTKMDDYGMAYKSIILFDKRESRYEVTELTDQAAEQMGCRILRVVKEYKCYLQIDLWLFVLEFDWIESL